MKDPGAECEGPSRLRGYLVAVRTGAAMASWQAVAGQEIGLVRKRYDAGLVEICQGRHGGHCQLYAIPRRTRSPTRHYFAPDGLDLEIPGRRRLHGGRGGT